MIANPLITDPFGIITVLLCIEGIIFYLAEHRATRKVLDVIPSMFWIYFLPLVATTVHLIPQESEVYPFISKNLLPGSLILLLISVDVRAILKLGKTALLMMFAGSAGIVLGGPIVLLLFQRWLPVGIWSGFGALSASWTGGSANMLGVKEGLGTPNEIYTLMVVVDSIVPYIWMAILIALAGYQTGFDKWNRSNITVMHDLNKKIAGVEKRKSEPLTLKFTALIFAVAFAGSYLSTKIAQLLPEVKNAIATYTWMIVIATTVGILLSFTKAKKLETFGASKIGYGMLYFVLASFGARASLTDIRTTPILIAAGIVWVMIHALFVLAAARVLRAPLFLAAASSQANIGGVASAPVVAEAYQPALAPVGLLLAILGNIIGTYLGIICGQLCKMVSRF
ncbi:MAG: DUF819 family protein [Phycisphaerae bacterium]